MSGGMFRAASSSGASDGVGSSLRAGARIKLMLASPIPAAIRGYPDSRAEEYPELASGSDGAERLEVSLPARLVEHEPHLLDAGVEESLELIPALLG